jgi:hypothetical protein
VCDAFYSSEQNASLGLNELEEKYTSASRTLLFRAENEKVATVGQFDIIVEPTQKINTYEERILCEGPNPTIVLDSGVKAPALTSTTHLLMVNRKTQPPYQYVKRRRVYCSR